MNTTKRLVFGVLSCLLLAAGFAQAADRLDPMNRILPVTSENSVMGPPNTTCSMPCNYL